MTKAAKPIKGGNNGYPKEIVVKRENLDTRDEYLRAETDPAIIAEVGEAVVVGVYKLVRTEIITAPISRHPTWMGMKMRDGKQVTV